MGDFPSSDGEPHHSKPWYQFGLGKLFLATTLVALLGAGWAAISQVSTHGDWSLATMLAIVLLVLAGPPAALIVASLFRAAIEWFRDRAE